MWVGKWAWEFVYNYVSVCREVWVNEVSKWGWVCVCKCECEIDSDCDYVWVDKSMWVYKF